MDRHDMLRLLHEKVRPRTYVETGLDKGHSLRYSRVPSIGIDPEFSLTEEILADVQLARTSSDEFFARPEPLAHFAKPVIDLAFIDGMHLAEYALRDYLAIERFTEPAGVVVFDDMLPRTVLEANRRRASVEWTGDVFKAAQALRDLCPELVVIEVDTAPTGTVIVLLPDARRGGVLPGYDDWLDVAMSPDPQDVPDAVLRRTRAVKPERLLASRGWKLIPTLRGRRDDATRELLREAFSDVTPG